MKNIIVVFLLVSLFAFTPACSPKSEEMTEEQQTEADAKAALDEEQKAKDAEARREAIEKAKIEKEQQRQLVLLEKVKASPTYTDELGNVVYYKSEIAPSYPAGNDGLNKYLEDNLKYPEEARNQGHEGTVFVDFIIDTNGQVREVVASDVVGENVDEAFKTEAVRVVSEMEGWNPGMQNGKQVATSFSLPITFYIRN